MKQHDSIQTSLNDTDSAHSVFADKGCSGPISNDNVLNTLGATAELVWINKNLSYFKWKSGV